MLMAQNLIEQGFRNVNAEDFARAVSDTMSNGELAISPQDANTILQEAFQKQQAGARDQQLAADQAFMADYAKQSGVEQTASGMYYKVKASGEGQKPSASSQVTVHYTGKLTNGQVFDSSIQRGQPAKFPVNGVIAGWQEALQMMNEGDKWEVVIPYDLAYGEQGSHGAIPPYAALVFDVELLEVH